VAETTSPGGFWGSNTVQRIRHQSDLFARLAALVVVVAVWPLSGAVALGDDVPQSYTEAMAWYGEEARAGNPDAQYLLGFALETGARTERNAQEARDWYAAAADQGHTRAQIRLGLMMLEGLGGPADAEGARDWLGQAAESGAVDAMSLLGFILVTREPYDIGQAYIWFSLAAEAGDPAAAANLDALADTMTEAELDAAMAALAAWRAAHP